MSLVLKTIISEFRGGRVKFSWWGCGHGNGSGVTVLGMDREDVPRTITAWIVEHVQDKGRVVVA